MKPLDWLKALKLNQPCPLTPVISLMQERQVAGWLRVVSSASLKDAAEIKDLTAWRKRHARWFPTKFRVTQAGTRRWGGALIDNPRRILFMIIDLSGRRIGHIGLDKVDLEAKSAEIDNVLRGKKGGVGLMFAAMSGLESWANEMLQINSFSLRVFAGNRRAVRFYANSGYRQVASQQLVYHGSKTRGEWRPAPDAKVKTKRIFLVMEKVIF